MQPSSEQLSCFVIAAFTSFKSVGFSLSALSIWRSFVLLLSLRRCSILQASISACFGDTSRISVRKFWKIWSVLFICVACFSPILERERCLFSSSIISFFLMSGFREVESEPFEMFRRFAISERRA